MDRDTILGYARGFVETVGWTEHVGSTWVSSPHKKPLNRLVGTIGGSILDLGGYYLYGPTNRSLVSNIEIRSKKAKLAYLAGMIEGSGRLFAEQGSDRLYDAALTISGKEEYKGRAAATLAKYAKPYLTYLVDQAEMIRTLQANTDLWRTRARAGSVVPFRVLKKQHRWAQRLCPSSALAETNPEQAFNRSSYSPICSELLAAGLQCQRFFSTA